MKKIGIDIADTIIDVWPSLMIEADKYNKCHSNNPKSSENDLYLPEHIYSWTEAEKTDFWTKHGQYITFKSSLKEEVNETLEYLKSKNFYISFITAKSDDLYVNLEQNIIDYLNLHKLPVDEICVQIQNKGLFCQKNDISYLIDDSFDNCKGAVNCGLQSFLMTNPYNEEVELIKGITRLRKISEVKNYL